MELNTFPLKYCGIKINIFKVLFYLNRAPSPARGDYFTPTCQTNRS